MFVCVHTATLAPNGADKQVVPGELERKWKYYDSAVSSRPPSLGQEGETSGKIL